MTKDTWNNFVKTRNSFRNIVEELSQSLPNLKDLQQKFVNNRGNVVETVKAGTTYTVETPVVYNTALDDITINDEIKLILVADNPGRREQIAENRRYLVGPSGKIANKFFRDNPSLGIDFIKNVIILNKTPIHSPRTTDLRELCNMEMFGTQRQTGVDSSNSKLQTALEDSQIKMAEILLRFHEALNCPVWITGYSEMRKNGIFEIYTESLKKLYANKKDLYKQLYIYRHFSMNQFTIDLKQQTLPDETVAKSLKRIGMGYKLRILEKHTI